MIISIDKYKKTSGGGGGDAKPTEVLKQTITENGSQTFKPKEGYVFSSASITTNIHPTETLITTIKENGSHSFDGEYNGAEITVDVETFTPEGNVVINANGIHDIANYATATVSVQGDTENYSYFDGSVDVEGLRAIGWDDESIGMFRDNNLHYSWKNDDYIVSEENKALYGEIVDSNSISNNKDNPNFKYCPFFDTSNVTNMANMFHYCSSLTSIPLLDTSNVTNMNGMFSGCKSLTSIPLLDTGNVTDMVNMFCYCSFTSIPLLDTSNVTDMYSMFYGCSLLTSIPQLDTSNVTKMSSLFYGCKSLTSIPLLDTSNVTTMYYMFYDCSSLTSIPLLDTSNVTDMVNMFYNCISLTSIPLLDTSNVKDMGYMFSGCNSLTSIPLLDTSNVTNMGYLFGWGTINTLTDLGGFKNLSISVTSSFLEKCPKLTVESLMNVINNLATVSDKSLKFGSTNLNKLTPDQIAIATAKGWTLTT